MEITSVFKNSLSYPLSDYKKLLIIGIITIISQLGTIISSYGYSNDILSIVLGIISIIFGLILGGYVLSVIKSTIESNNEIPDFNYAENIIMGIKYIILEIVYYIIPTVIVILVGVATGLFDSFIKIFEVIDFNNLGANETTINQAISTLPQSTLTTFVTSLSITAIVAIILFIIFGFFMIIGTCRLAESNSLSSGLSIKKVFGDISAIGWGSFILWCIILVIISFIIGFISSLVSMIPYIGVIITTLIISPFLLLFVARAMGLMYISKQEDPSYMKLPDADK